MILGNGPTLRLTCKVQGKTISEALPTPAAVRKAEQEIAEFREYQGLSRTFEIDEKICRLRPVEQEGLITTKKGPKPSARKLRAN
jgi:hypothetical protein